MSEETKIQKPKCVACEVGAEALSPEVIQDHLAGASGWQLIDDGKKIRKDWEVRNFAAAMEFFNAIAEIAEDRGHHPDLHLVSYRKVTIVIWTHAIGGLSQYDFELAAAIDQLPVKLPKGKAK